MVREPLGGLEMGLFPKLVWWVKLVSVEGFKCSKVADTLYCALEMTFVFKAQVYLHCGHM